MTPAARQDLIERHLPLVRRVARRFAGTDEPLEDLVQVGTIGLIKAVDRYDGGRGIDLGAYATPAIAGEIRHHLRDRSAPAEPICIRSSCSRRGTRMAQPLSRK